jgi:CheY-like chemotaxis protein
MRSLITPAAPATSTGLASKSVLIVEDEPRIQVLVSSIATKLGYASTAVSNGMEAIDAYREGLTASESFSLVVMDLALPGGMSGLEATYAIKQIDESAKIIASSAYLGQPARDAVLEHGFDGILPKPYTAERLACEFDRVLDKDF